MSAMSPLKGHPGEKGKVLSPHKLTSIFSVSLLICLNVLILGGFITYLVITFQPEPSQVLAAVPHTSSALTLKRTKTPTPEPSRTPFLYLIPTSTPTSTPLPTHTPQPTVSLPEEARVYGISGRRQSMPLSCESRSAVDWAAYFGESIDETAFHNGLPVHDNPDKGFVGDVYGSWGQIPPKDYGVHAGPVAHRLREYGLNAKYVFDMTLDELKSEIAAGRPVIIWVVGHVGLGTPVEYTDSEGQASIVAKFEHTVIVIGYTKNKVLILDGAKTYTRYYKEFQKSWDVLENQAIIWID